MVVLLLLVNFLVVRNVAWIRHGGFSQKGEFNRSYYRQPQIRINTLSLADGFALLLPAFQVETSTAQKLPVFAFAVTVGFINLGEPNQSCATAST